MEYVYDCYVKTRCGETLYFVKKYLRCTDLAGVSDIQEGYGMHPVFARACAIAGVTDAQLQAELWLSLEQRKAEAQAPVLKLESSLAPVVRITA